MPQKCVCVAIGQPPVFLRSCPFWYLGLLIRLVSPRDTFFEPLDLGVEACMTTPNVFTWVLRIELRSSCLHTNTLAGLLPAHHRGSEKQVMSCSKVFSVSSKHLSVSFPQTANP